MSKNIKTLEQLKDSRLLYEKKMPVFGYMIVIVIAALVIAITVWSVYTPKINMIKADGIVESDNKNYVMSQYSGELIKVAVEEGSKVEKGDILFQVKSNDFDMQLIRLEEQRNIYEVKFHQYEKLVKSIRDDTNYFDVSELEDSLYYSQFETYKSQMEQSQVNTNMYRLYGYTDEQIETELIKNEAKMSEIYYSAIQSAQNAMEEADVQIKYIDAQLLALKNGQGEYTITASTTGIVHMISDYKEGMMIQAASPIASIVSLQDKYSIIAYVTPDSMARIHVGDSVDIAVKGLAQSIYGTIKGKVEAVDTDITINQNQQSGTTSSYFKLYLKPESEYLISRAGNKVNLSNGMEVEARIRYDEISYFYYVLEALGVVDK